MKDKGNDATLLRVAEAISDGSVVDWNALQAGRQDLRRTLNQLRSLEALATAHRAPAVPARGVRAAVASIGSTATAVAPNVKVGAQEAPSLSTWGPLKILALLGSGGFGDVYRAYDPSLQREVALKILRSEGGHGGLAPASFLAEARRLARVRHPNVLDVHGAEEHGGLAGFWTDLVEGKTLEQCLAEQGPSSAREACLIGIDLCGALAAVHASGLIHRDVKSTNVMREHGGRIVLMDFGSIAERVGEGMAGSHETPTGTPLFMAPELLRGEAATPAADIYSLGVLLYRLVSGHFPVEASSLTELLDKHRRGERVPLRDHRPDLPAGFVQVIERALSATPDQRYASAGAMEQALAGSLGLREAEDEIQEEHAVPLWRRRGAWIAVGGAAVVLAAVASFLKPTPPSTPIIAEAALYRLGARTEDRLQEESPVRPGDRLFLEIRAPEKLYVYVLSEDEKGEVFVLFPAEGGLKNPLAAEVRHRL
ncbi:MAG TPA: protein kinase, partial [Candidatus Polarisedimenticolia bacterium]|nr:protein kinase [Candidatus Polarisedimenticolia bacterium]